MIQVRHVLPLAALLALVLRAGVASAQDPRLEARSFLPLAAPPPNFVPLAGAAEEVSVVVARGDGLVFVGRWNAESVTVVDARDPAAPRVVCDIPTANPVEGMALDGNVLWIGGSDGSADSDGLMRTTLPANPFTTCPPAPTFVAGIESGVTPAVFDAGGRRRVLVANRSGFDLKIFDVGSSTVVGRWTPPAGVQLADASVLARPGGQVLAAVAAVRSGVFLLDVTAPATPTVLAHFDWTFQAPDFDGVPATADGCDRNGDGDFLECGESGRNGDGLRLNFVNRAVLAEVDGATYVITSDGGLAGHVQVFALSDVLARCPGVATCPDDAALNTSSGPPWPVVDVVPLRAFYQVDECPLAVENFEMEGDVLFVAYYEAGVHVIDLAAQGLGAGGPAFEMTPLVAFDTLPGDSDTVLENYPCHPIGASDGCESVNVDWNPTPCQPTPPVSAQFRVVRNAGLRSATDVEWAGCRLHVTDQGSPDADGTTAHVGTPQGLWTLEFAAGAFPGVGESLVLTRDPADRATLLLSWDAAPLSLGYRVYRGTLRDAASWSYDHACVAASAVPSATLAGFGSGGPPASYYLVSATCGASESGVGLDSFGDPRPPGLSGACP